MTEVIGVNGTKLGDSVAPRRVQHAENTARVEDRHNVTRA